MPNKKWFDNCGKYEKWIDKIQALERLKDENKKNTQTQRNLDKNFAYHPPHDETEEGWPKVVRKPTLLYPITIHDLLADDSHLHSTPVDVKKLNGIL